MQRQQASAGAIAWSVGYPLRMQAVPRSTLAPGTFFRGDFLLLIQDKQFVNITHSGVSYGFKEKKNNVMLELVLKDI